MVSIPGNSRNVMEIRGLQTRIRDLAQGHEIEIPNYNLLQYRTDYLRKSKEADHSRILWSSISDGIPSSQVEKLSECHIPNCLCF